GGKDARAWARHARPRLEALEGREVPATFTWKWNAATSAWGDVNNWSWDGGGAPTRTPGSADIVYLESSSNDPVITSNASVLNLRTQTGGAHPWTGLDVLTVQKCKLFTGTGTSTFSNGTLKLDSTATGVETDFFVGGTFNFSGNIQGFG